MTLREEITKESRRKYRFVIILLFGFLVCSTLVSLCLGKYSMTLGRTLEILGKGFVDMFNQLFGGESILEQTTDTNVVLGIRLPRIFASMIVGASLSVAGATYQGVFRNQLVSPDFLGVSSGACIGAAIAILMGLASAYIQGFAFVGGILAVSITVTIPRLFKTDSNIFLVLSGIIVNGLMSSIMAFIKYTADPDSELAAITYWQMGSLAYVRPTDILAVLAPIVAAMVVIMLMSWSIDVVSLGEREAKALGVNVQRVTYISIACATLLTAGSVCVSGTIGWIGLVVPHFARLIVGPDNTKLMPVAALLGASFLLLVDTGCRNIGVSELPISILTGAIGAPFYAILLYKQRARIQ